MEDVFKTIEKIEALLNEANVEVEKLKYGLLLEYIKDKEPTEKEPLTYENISSDNSILGILAEVLEDSAEFNTTEKIVAQIKKEIAELESSTSEDVNINNAVSISEELDKMELEETD